MEKENNPWLDITKQESISDSPQKPGLFETTFEMAFESTFGNGWRAKDFEITYAFNSVKEYDPIDLDEATIMLEFFETTLIYDEFETYCFREHGITPDNSSKIWNFLSRNIGKSCLEQELVTYMYEEGIWD
jgi:hypothetical protein